MSLQAAPPRGWQCPGAALAAYALAEPSGTRGAAAARAARLGSQRGHQAGALSSPRTGSDWEVRAPTSIISLRGVGRWDGGVERTGEGAAGGATAPEPWGEGPEARGGGAVVRIPHLPPREWEPGPGESPAEPSARPRRGRGRGPAPAARPFPSCLPLPPKRSGAGRDPPAQEGCRAGSASPRLLAAGCGPSAAGRRRARRRAESGAAPPRFCPNAGGLLSGRTACRDPLRCCRPTGAALRGRSGGHRGSPAPGAPCTPWALSRSGRSRRSSLLARWPPPPPPPRERPPHPLLPPPPRPPRRSGLGLQRLAAASAPGPAAAPASAPRGHPQAGLWGPRGVPAPLPRQKFSSRLRPLWSLQPRAVRSLRQTWGACGPPPPLPQVFALPVLAPLFCIPPFIPLPPSNPTSAPALLPPSLPWPSSIGRFLSCQTCVRRAYWVILGPGGRAKGGRTGEGRPGSDCCCE